MSLTAESLPALQAALEQAGLDGWLLYDFHGLNPVAVGMLELPGMTTRRFFVYIPRRGEPVAITHAIEQGPWAGWPGKWRKETYSSWRVLGPGLPVIQPRGRSPTSFVSPSIAWRMCRRSTSSGTAP